MKQSQENTELNYQKTTWEALRKTLNGLINKVNINNVKKILPEIFHENLVRGRGLFIRSLMKSQASSPTFTAVYAALVSVINTKLPEIGLLLLKRLALHFRKAFKRNDKAVCITTARFIAHLVNQGVAHEIIGLEILMLLLERPSDDSVDLAVRFAKEVGAALQDLSPQGFNAVFERFRRILHEGVVGKRVSYTIEGLFTIRRVGFDKSGQSAKHNDLDLVDEEDQITHEVSLDDEIDPETMLDVFEFDSDYKDHNEQYESFKREILEIDESEDIKEVGIDAKQEVNQVHDKTETKLINLRRTIYLTIMSSLDFEEAGHKLLNIVNISGQEIELVTMIIECCSQEKTYIRYFGLLAQRFCYLNRCYQTLFEQCFDKQYMLVHRLATGKLRNIAKLYAHLMGTDAISWAVLQCIRLTMEDTTSSGRIFIKILFQELAENIGLKKICVRIRDPSCACWFANIFPRGKAADIRFSINFFTSIGLGGLTDSQRNYLRQMPRLLASKHMEQQAQVKMQQATARVEVDSSSSHNSSLEGSTSDSSQISSTTDRSTNENHSSFHVIRSN
jgi:pre-mRNA-splicing factor CWC22